MMPKTVSTPCSPRLVPLIVGSDSSELRRPPARARWTRSRKFRMRSPRLWRSASWRAGATTPPPLSEMAKPTGTASLGTPRAPAPTACPSRRARRPGLEGQAPVQEATRARAPPVLLGEPRQRALHVDRAAQVVVGDLALGPGHGRPDRLPHPGLAVHLDRRPRRRGVRPRTPPRGPPP